MTFPVIALLISTLIEGYHWTPAAVLGLGLTRIGNVVMFARRRGGTRTATGAASA